MRSRSLPCAALPLVAWAAAGDPDALDAQRARLGEAFHVPRAELAGLRVAVDAVESGPEGRRPLGGLESELAGLFEALGVPRLEPGGADRGALMVACRVGLSRLEDGVGWGLFRWEGACDVTRRGRVGITAARAGGASHPDADTAMHNARHAARRALVEALRGRLERLLAAGT